MNIAHVRKGKHRGLGCTFLSLRRIGSFALPNFEYHMALGRLWPGPTGHHENRTCNQRSWGGGIEAGADATAANAELETILVGTGAEAALMLLAPMVELTAVGAGEGI